MQFFYYILKIRLNIVHYHHSLSKKVPVICYSNQKHTNCGNTINTLSLDILGKSHS